METCFSILLLVLIPCLILSFPTFTGDRIDGLPEIVGPPQSEAHLRAPPRSIPGYSLLSEERLLFRRQILCFFLHSSGTALHFLPSQAFQITFTRNLQGTEYGYPRTFSPMPTDPNSVIGRLRFSEQLTGRFVNRVV